MSQFTKIKDALIAGLAFGCIFGLMIAYSYGIGNAVVFAPAMGFAFAVFMYFFMASKAIDRQSDILTDEAIVKFGPANYFSGSVAVGGKLHLTRTQLIFKSHHFNAGSQTVIIRLADIETVGFYNTLGLIPNGLSVTLRRSRTEKFVVKNRKLWKAEIETLAA